MNAPQAEERGRLDDRLTSGADSDARRHTGLKTETGIGSRTPRADAGTLNNFFPVGRVRRTFAFVATVVHGDFEWDEAKAASNLAKHGVSFEEATLAMKDPFSQDFDDALHSANLVTLAASPSGRILYIVSTESDQRIRIISARDATRHERRLYEETE